MTKPWRLQDRVLPMRGGRLGERGDTEPARVANLLHTTRAGVAGSLDEVDALLAREPIGRALPAFSAIDCRGPDPGAGLALRRGTGSEPAADQALLQAKAAGKNRFWLIGRGDVT